MTAAGGGGGGGIFPVTDRGRGTACCFKGEIEGDKRTTTRTAAAPLVSLYKHWLTAILDSLDYVFPIILTAANHIPRL